jgi:apolipoprotein N-acyltransferase
VSVVQGNIDQSVKWKPEYQQKTLSTYETLTRTTAGFRPRITVWPETAVPFFFQEAGDNSRRVVDIAEASGGALLFGSPAYERTGDGVRYLNRAYLVDPSDRSIRHYDKVHLVPFGEYVPLKQFLFFIQRLVPAAGDFAAGAEVAPLRLGTASIGVLICFEAIFPDLARRMSRQGANVLVNLTNDAWFGRTSAPHQHLAMAAFRAVETRRPLVRAANTGISAFVLPSGKIGPSSPLFAEAVLTESVRLAPAGLPFYARHGDLFAQASLVLALARLLSLALARRRARLHS